jgi:hypothetical protein
MWFLGNHRLQRKVKGSYSPPPHRDETFLVLIQIKDKY